MKQHDFEYFSVHSSEVKYHEEDISVVIQDQEYANQMSDIGKKLIQKDQMGSH